MKTNLNLTDNINTNYNINTTSEDSCFQIGLDISNIINQDGDEKTDGEVIDEIVEYLSKNNLYFKR